MGLVGFVGCPGSLNEGVRDLVAGRRLVIGFGFAAVFVSALPIGTCFALRARSSSALPSTSAMLGLLPDRDEAREAWDTERRALVRKPLSSSTASSCSFLLVSTASSGNESACLTLAALALALGLAAPNFMMPLKVFNEVQRTLPEQTARREKHHSFTSSGDRM